MGGDFEGEFSWWDENIICNMYKPMWLSIIHRLELAQQIVLKYIF